MADCAWDKTGICIAKEFRDEVGATGVDERRSRSDKVVGGVMGLFNVVRLSVDIAGEKMDEGDCVEASYSEFE